jgi:hypothetical protein
VRDRQHDLLPFARGRGPGEEVLEESPCAPGDILAGLAVGAPEAGRIGLPARAVGSVRRVDLLVREAFPAPVVHLGKPRIQLHRAIVGHGAGRLPCPKERARDDPVEVLGPDPCRERGGLRTPRDGEPDVDPLPQVLLRVGAVRQAVPSQDEGQHGRRTIRRRMRQ